MKHWNFVMYYYAINWWRDSNHYGTGHFNQELYEKFLEIRYGLTFKN
jgi:hypothetical protein